MNTYLELIVLSLFLFISCKEKQVSEDVNKSFDISLLNLNPTAKIGEYVVEIFEDSKGNLWFGTLSKGMAKYDGQSLKYFNIKDGLPNNAVVDIEEDEDGVLWVGTQNGLSSFDGENFTNYLVDVSDDESRLSNLLIDSKGVLWIGTWAGVMYHDGKEFKSLDLPIPDVELKPYLRTMNWVTELVEGNNGNILIGRDGYGLTLFDSEEFTFITKSEGLLSNNITDVAIDPNGSLWVGNRMVERDDPRGNQKGDAGVVFIDDDFTKTFELIKGLYKSDVYALYKSSDDTLWIGTISNGLYNYVENEFINYEFEGGENKPIQKILKDSQGQIWLGCSGGLYKLENNLIKHYSVGKFL